MTTRKIILTARFSLSIAFAMALATSAFADMIYVSGSSAGTAGGISFQDEDIMVLDTGSGSWSIYFDGSDVGLAGGADVNAFTILGDGNILMSFDSPVTVGGLSVQGADIVEFTPTSIGATTSGTFSLFFDGSDVGFSLKKSNVDAISFTPDERLVISLDNNFEILTSGGGTLAGMDEDLIVFNATSLGISTAGDFALYFDGSETGFTNPNEDINGVSIDPVSAKVYLTVVRKFNVDGVKGGGLDIVNCEPSNFAPVSSCNSPLTIQFDGSDNDLGNKSVDGVFIFSVD